MAEGSPSHTFGALLRKQGIIILFIAITLALLGSTMYFYTQYQKASTSGQEKQDDISALVAQVGRHILLPEGEVPKVVTVTDRDKFSGQAFFVHAKNGDKVLVYEKAKKAFLFDPKADRVLEVGPVTFNDASEKATVSAQVPVLLETPVATPRTESYRFVLYNGTTVAGLTTAYEPTLTAAVPGALVVDRDNAATADYRTSVLIDIAGTLAGQASSISQTLAIPVGILPAGETLPAGADFLIILGEDKK